MRPSHCAWRLSLLLLLGLCLARTASGQEAPLPTRATLPVQVEVESFGVGDTVRPGDWMGVRLRLIDDGDRVRAAGVRLHVEDVDGDTALMERRITLNPGRPVGVWLYARLPHGTGDGEAFTVTVHALAGDAADAPLGRRIGATRIQPRRLLDASRPMIGIVGRQRLGLQEYTTQTPRSQWPPTSHELIALVADLVPQTMPDAWLGLASFETLLWVEGDPSSLTEASAQGVREWVHRGGHLVVVLPPIGQTWTDGRSNPLIDLMPRARVERRDQVDLEAYRPMLTDLRGVPLPDESTLHVFTREQDATPSEATPLLRGPDRAAVAMRRIVGAGMVTLIGFDLADRRLAGRLDAETFWHRVLGKRFNAFSLPEIEAIQRTAERTPNFTSRQGVWLDSRIAAEINMTGRAGRGLLLSVALFVAYLLLQGPLGYTLLRRRGWTRHAWSLFVLIAGLFTIVAWTGAETMRPARTEIRSITLIDHVYGQPVDRARSWMSVLLPDYGQRRVSIEQPERAVGAAPAWRDALSVWEDPMDPVSRAFPNPREYVVDARRPNSIDAPARSTVKQFRADWLGGPPFPMPRPVNGSEVILADAGLRGVIEHDLPAALDHVQIVLVRGQKGYGRVDPESPGGPLPADVRAWSLSEAWEAGRPLDLSTLGEASTGEEFFDVLAARQSGGGSARAGGASAGLSTTAQQFDALTWGPMLAQPHWRVRRGTERALQRRAAHTYDLGKWFTQPCLIVVGQMQRGPTPVPLRVEGREVLSRGRTVLRWIYPLAPRPVAAPPMASEASEPRRAGLASGGQEGGA